MKNIKQKCDNCKESCLCRECENISECKFIKKNGCRKTKECENFKNTLMDQMIKHRRELMNQMSKTGRIIKEEKIKRDPYRKKI